MVVRLIALVTAIVANRKTVDLETSFHEFLRLCKQTERRVFSYVNITFRKMLLGLTKFLGRYIVLFTVIVLPVKPLEGN